MVFQFLLPFIVLTLVSSNVIFPSSRLFLHKETSDGRDRTFRYIRNGEQKDFHLDSVQSLQMLSSSRMTMSLLRDTSQDEFKRVGDSCFISFGSFLRGVVRGSEALFLCAEKSFSETNFGTNSSILQQTFDIILEHYSNEIISIAEKVRIVTTVEPREGRVTAELGRQLQGNLTHLMERIKGLSDNVWEYLSSSSSAVDVPLTTAALDNDSSSRAPQEVDVVLLNAYERLSGILKRVEPVSVQLSRWEDQRAWQQAVVSTNRKRFETSLQITSMSIGMGAMLSGIFGMNLFNHFERSRIAFYIVSVILLVAQFAMHRLLVAQIPS